MPLNHARALKACASSRDLSPTVFAIMNSIANCLLVWYDDSVKKELVSLNQVMMPRDEAYISPDDRGFRFGDGVFETIAIVEGQFYLWNAHILRLNEGLKLLRINVALDDLHNHAMQLVEANDIHQGMLRIMITRGAGSQGYLPTHEGQPTIFIETLPTAYAIGSGNKPLALGVSQWRRFPPSVLPNRAKIAQGLNATLARMEAANAGYDEALMLSVDGDVAEAASGNLFWRNSGRVYTPSLATGCLAGTMRGRLMELLEVEECITPLDDLECDALIMTNAVRGAVAVASLHVDMTRTFLHSESFVRDCNRLIQKDIATMLASSYI